MKDGGAEREPVGVRIREGGPQREQGGSMAEMGLKLVTGNFT